MNLLILAFVLFCFAFACYFILLKFSTNLGIRKNHEGQIRFTSEQKPAFGGGVFYLVLILSAMMYAVYASSIDVFRFTMVMSSLSLGFLIGLADDAYNTNPRLKLVGQLVCTFLLIFGGFYIRVFEHNFLNYGLTCFWVIGMMNSVNMLDNMDGTAATTSLIIALVAYLFGWIFGMHAHFLTFLNLGIIAVLIAFLFFNWHPSRLYMGDSGSMVLGLLLAFIGIELFWNPKDIHGVAYFSKKLLIVLSIFIVPIADTTTVVINRMRKGQSPFVGGKDHTTHHLSYLGVPTAAVPLILLLLSLIGGLVAFRIIKVEYWSLEKIVFYSFLVFFLFFGIYSVTFTKKK